MTAHALQPPRSPDASVPHAACPGFELLMGPGSRASMEHILHAHSSTIRLRGLSLLVAVASTNPDSLHDLHASGECLCQELSCTFPTTPMHSQ